MPCHEQESAGRHALAGRAVTPEVKALQVEAVFRDNVRPLRTMAYPQARPRLSGPANVGRG